ncbi:hypothetical protein I3843_02G055200 [Carya illinoinensis]|nr:hypothetical protein I3843_02G055200 [Carya illinoinensis]
MELIIFPVRVVVVGKEFDEVEDAQTFYKMYARRTGFAMRTNHTRLSKDDRKLILVEYVCSREGFRCESRKQIERKIPEPAETKIGYKATMCIKNDCEKWTVCKFVCEHNHELLTPKSTSLLRGHRGITRIQKKLILILNESGVPTRKIVLVLNKESGGDFNIGCIEGDAQMLYTYFLDRSRVAYQYFGDVVTFDATYLTNIYKMPFVLFSGINHHHQKIMFGCALLVNKIAESYIWLLRTWQEVMLGRAPSTIITDDDKAMAKTIGVVLPNTTHRLCLWHILQKISEHLAHIYNNLLDNDWLQNLYNRRDKWVPAYLRTTFCAAQCLRCTLFQGEREGHANKIDTGCYENFMEIEVEAASDELFNNQRIYGVTPNDKEQPIYHVTLESGDAKVICTCHMFEFVGILYILPHHYILERWTINAKSWAVLGIPNFDGHVMTHDDPMMRKSKLMMQFYDIAKFGSQSPQKYNHLSLTLDKIHKELLFIEDIEGEKNIEGGNMSQNDSDLRNTGGNISQNLDPSVEEKRLKQVLDEKRLKHYFQIIRQIKLDVSIETRIAP